MRHAAQKRPSARGRLPFLRARALLAGGLVLGLGATATAASWNDSEYATATLTTSTFNTESSVGGQAWADNASPPGATVTLAVGAFSPGTVAYLPVLIRTKVNSIAGTVVMGGATFTGTDAALLSPVFTYRVVRTTATCDSTAFSGTPVFVIGASGGVPLTTVPSTSLVNTLAAATTVATGASTGFCLEVTLPTGASNTLQGKTASATWQFLATSN